MKTIEERADRYIDNNFCRIAEDMPICEGMKTLYIESATEQEAIDEKSQIEEMRKLNEEWEENLRIQKEMLIDKACEWLMKNNKKYLHWSTECLVDGLREAMEQ